MQAERRATRRAILFIAGRAASRRVASTSMVTRPSQKARSTRFPAIIRSEVFQNRALLSSRLPWPALDDVVTELH